MRPALIVISAYAYTLLFGVALFADDKPSEETKPFGLEKRIPFTGSRVVGSPEPPYPFHVVPAFEKLKIEKPVYLEEEPGTKQFLVIQQDGKIFRFPNDPAVEEPTLLIDLDQSGYGLTFHPDYLKNGYLFVLSNGPKDARKNKIRPKNRLSRFTVSRDKPWTCDPKSELTILEWESGGHNGGDLEFGPDGFLYIPTGDGTSDSDTENTGQDLTNLNSVLIRIDVDHPGKDKLYSIPKDNPFLHIPDARPEVWAFGFRNPWRCTFDKKTGDFWVGNVGQDLWELIHVAKRGDNYGWAAFEGSHPFHEQRKMGPAPHTPPTIEHPHSESRSITGGIVYYGKKFPELVGKYIYGDYATGKYWAAKYENGKITEHTEIADGSSQPAGFAVDSKGEILIIDYPRGLSYLERKPADSLKPSDFPQTLSETGLFESVEGHIVQSGLIPYDVVSPLWSDGSLKERYIALPGEEKVGFTRARSWTFPELTVLVKTFSLEMEDGNPASRQRIETRLLVLQEKEWVGYSYIWNDEQTEATLVEKKGADRMFRIKNAQEPNGERELKWHYPSRAECMMCHSRASRYVLGLTERQMNRDFDYGEVVDNQIRTLDHIGLFKGKLPKSPEELERHAALDDEARTLEERARSYLETNCAHCHVEAGGGNSRMNLEARTDKDKTYIYDVEPQHHKFDIDGARIVDPGHPDKSVMLHRLTRRGKGQMPPLGTTHIDEAAVKLFRDWIRTLPARAPTEEAK